MSKQIVLSPHFIEKRILLIRGQKVMLSSDLAELYGVQPKVLIQAVKRKVDEINAAGGEIFEGLKQGDLVEIRSGPFAGYEAIFDARLPGRERVRVLLRLLQGKSAIMEVPAGLLERKKRR